VGLQEGRQSGNSMWEVEMKFEGKCGKLKWAVAVGTIIGSDKW
jgi:hypothetical protein